MSTSAQLLSCCVTSKLAVLIFTAPTIVPVLLDILEMVNSAQVRRYTGHSLHRVIRENS